MKGLKEIFREETESLNSQNLLRVAKISDRTETTKIIRNGKEFTSFSCNDYLGLANDEKLKNASIKAIENFGTGSGASRLITGNNNLYETLEKNITKLHGCAEAVVFSSGYAANIGAIPALVSKGDIIIADKLSHNCILEGAKLSGAELKRFNHNNYSHLEKLLKEHRKDFNKCLIITESVFSMDGDRANLKKISELAKKYNAFVMADFAHDIEFDKWDIDNDNFIKMGTLSKAFASLGGYICGSKGIKDFMLNRAKSLIFSTALPPSALASANEAFLLANKNKKQGKQALKNADHFYDLVKNRIGEFLINKPESQVVPVIIGEARKALNIAKKLEEAKLLVHAIRYPTVAKNTARLRFSFSTAHTEKDVENLAKALISASK